MAVNAGQAIKKSTERKSKWGVKLKLDVNKAVSGLAAHPTASQLLVLFEDGSLRSYAMSSTGLQSLWPAGWMLPGWWGTVALSYLDQHGCNFSKSLYVVHLDPCYDLFRTTSKPIALQGRSQICRQVYIC